MCSAALRGVHAAGPTAGNGGFPDTDPDVGPFRDTLARLVPGLGDPAGPAWSAKVRVSTLHSGTVVQALW